MAKSCEVLDKKIVISYRYDSKTGNPYLLGKADGYPTYSKDLIELAERCGTHRH